MKKTKIKKGRQGNKYKSCMKIKTQLDKQTEYSEPVFDIPELPGVNVMPKNGIF